MYWLIGVMLLNSQLYLTKIHEFNTHEECIHAMREAEIVVQAENKQLVCIKDVRGFMTFEENSDGVYEQGFPLFPSVERISRM